MRKLRKEQLKLRYFNAVRRVLILENGLLPGEADAALSAAGLKEDIENLHYSAFGCFSSPGIA